MSIFKVLATAILIFPLFFLPSDGLFFDHLKLLSMHDPGGEHLPFRDKCSYAVAQYADDRALL